MKNYILKIHTSLIIMFIYLQVIHCSQNRNQNSYLPIYQLVLEQKINTTLNITDCSIRNDQPIIHSISDKVQYNMTENQICYFSFQGFSEKKTEVQVFKLDNITNYNLEIDFDLAIGFANNPQFGLPSYSETEKANWPLGDCSIYNWETCSSLREINPETILINSKNNETRSFGVQSFLCPIQTGCKFEIIIK